VAQFFFTSFAAAENRAYVARFHGDLVRELAALTGEPVSAPLCAGGGSARPAAPDPGRPAASAGVMVALCSAAYYADEGCGLDWALMERRLCLRRSALCSPRVLVRWQPADPPHGLPRAPFDGTDVVSAYARVGLRGIMHADGWHAPGYTDAVRRIARAVRAGHETGLPPLPPDQQADVRPAFPVGPLDVPGQRPPPGERRRPQSAPGPRRAIPGRKAAATAAPPALPADAERRMARAADPNGSLFYISYVPPDEEWACWVEYHVRMLGHRTVMDVYDWQPGLPLADRRRDALERADTVIALSSPAYVRPDSPTAPEWGDAMRHVGPDGSRRFLPLLIKDTELPPLLRDVITASLVGLSGPRAREAIAAALAGRGERERPHEEPPLPSS
jgi:hypothetical protein